MLLAVYTGIVIDKCCMIDTLQMNVCIAMGQKTCKSRNVSDFRHNCCSQQGADVWLRPTACCSLQKGCQVSGILEANDGFLPYLGHGEACIQSRPRREDTGQATSKLCFWNLVLTTSTGQERGVAKTDTT